MAHSEHHHHHHHHHHHNHHTNISSGADIPFKSVYYIAIVLNLGFVVAEAAVGLVCNSLGLLSDAGHNLSDVFSLLLALSAFRLMKSHSREGFTYGFKKSSVLISLANAVILLVAVGAIIMESISKFRNPVLVNGAAISWTAGIGIIINGLTTFMLMRVQDHDINTKGAYLHMLADTLVSVGVVVSGIVISITGWSSIDPIISLAIAGIIFFSTFDLLKESIRMSIDAIPEGIDEHKVTADIETVAGVRDAHHMHIWPVSTMETAMTVHVVVENILDSERVRKDVRQVAKQAGIYHCTIEVESSEESCNSRLCC